MQLSTAITALVRRYHTDTAEVGRRHRVVVAVHPTVTTETGDGQPGGRDEEGA